MCGENDQALTDAAMGYGSSPRVRGKRGRRQAHRRPGGLIPACAGKTRSASSSPPTWRAHPRVCGENSPCTAGAGPPPGSSPRVRGKRVHESHERSCPGLIPACAGKTGVTCWRHPLPGAHPRVCGENLQSSHPGISDVGSSPRVRGKRREGGQGQPLSRLIPACAGKTPRPRCGTSSPGAHPRVCGENYW